MRYTLSLSCADRIGIVAKVANFLAERDGFIVESAQYGDPSTNRFFMRTVFTTKDSHPFDLTAWKEAFKETAALFEMDWKLKSNLEKTKIIILVSKAGHCLNTLLNQYATGTLNVDVAAVGSNHLDLEAMCKFYKIPFHYLPITQATKPLQESKIFELFQSYHAELLVLARYMQILSPKLTQKLQGKAINIHHSFLPSFKGAKPYHQAYERGVKLIGATAHYVSDDLDEGPIIEQEVLRVDHNETPEELVASGRDIESVVLARAVKYHVEDRVFLDGRKTVVFR